MKIEKVNDNQIRCTLTREDLANRELKISELAYGTDKAKELFHDMMEQASHELGFEAEDIPLMIEAIPLSSECIVLVITKVEDPEELDTRFSRFAPSVNDAADAEPSRIEDISDEVLDLFDRIHKTASKVAAEDKSDSVQEPDQQEVRIFAFQTLDPIYSVAKLLAKAEVCNTLYKDSRTGRYFLVLQKDSLSVQRFSKICNTLLEYGEATRPGQYSPQYMEEHFELILADQAVQKLAQIF